MNKMRQENKKRHTGECGMTHRRYWPYFET